MADLATLMQRLSDAEDSLHDLLITGGTTQLKHGDKLIGSGRMSANDLRAYISDLKGQIRRAGGCVDGGRLRSQPVRF